MPCAPFVHTHAILPFLWRQEVEELAGQAAGAAQEAGPALVEQVDEPVDAGSEPVAAVEARPAPSVLGRIFEQGKDLMR